MDYEKAKRALVEFILSPVERLSQERQAQYDRLQRAAQAKQHLDQTLAQRTHFS